MALNGRPPNLLLVALHNHGQEEFTGDDSLRGVLL